MPTEINIPTEIICTIIVLIGTITSALISFFVSRSTANKEIEKMKLTWEREDLVSSDDEFAEMASSVSRFLVNSTGSNQRDAISRIAAVRAKESGSIGEILDALYSSVRYINLQETNISLTKAIEERRKIKNTGKSKTTKGLVSPK